MLEHFGHEQLALLFDPIPKTSVHKTPPVASTCTWVPYHQHHFRRETPVLERGRSSPLSCRRDADKLADVKADVDSRDEPIKARLSLDTAHWTLGSLFTTQSTFLVTLCLRPFRMTGLEQGLYSTISRYELISDMAADTDRRPRQVRGMKR